RSSGRLTFDVAESIRAQFCPDASYQATLNACAARMKTPVVLVEAGLSLKKTELRALHSPQTSLLPTPAPKPCLRVLNAMPNPAARNASLQVHRHMRVPASSIIAKLFAADSSLFESSENLASWTTSDGSALVDLDVTIQARKAQDRVVAIITPLRDRRN